MNRLIGVALLVVVVLFPPPSPGQPGRPEVPKDIAVPPGYKLLARLEARGVQIYKAVEAKPGRFEWAFEAPLADLWDGKGGKAGYHYEGPSWEATDGSRIIWDKAEKVKSAPAPDAKADIPWLLIKVRAEGDEAGIFSPVVFVQRARTTGGKPPETAPKRAGTKVGVAYRAIYYFYSKAD
jgi:hypothetical protein